MIRILVCLIIVGSPCLLLAQDEGAGDANPKVIAVRVAILEVNGDFQFNDGTNLSAAGLNELLDKLRERKVLDRYQFFNLATVENQQASIQIGQEEGVVTGRTVSPTRSAGSRGGFGSSTRSTGSRGGIGSSRPPVDPRSFGGRVSNIYTTQQTGTHVQVVSRVRDDGKIVAQLSVASSRIKPAPVSESEEGEEGQPSTDFTPPSIDTIQCDTTALLESGVSMVIAAEGEDSDAAASRAYIIVSATVK